MTVAGDPQETSARGPTALTPPARRGQWGRTGGANWVIITSHIETAKLNGVNPHAWLTDTLTKFLNRWPASKIDDLMPWTYVKIPT